MNCSTSVRSRLVVVAAAIISIACFYRGDSTSIATSDVRGDASTNPPLLNIQLATAVRSDSSWSLIIDPSGLVPLPKPRCPTDRFVWVNTQTYGRHHNQLQEALNVVAWARTMNRTAVWPLFNHARSWFDPWIYYNFTRIMQRYCVVTTETFATQWRSLTSPRAYCLGQGVATTPLRKLLRCAMVTGIPMQYESRHGARMLPTYLRYAFTDAHASANFIGLSGQIGFFMRPGLAELAAVHTLLQPSASIGVAVDDFFQSHPRLTGKGFGVHIRSRETTCDEEMNWSFEDGAAWLQHLSLTAQLRIRRQCPLTLPSIDRIIAESVPQINDSTTAQGTFSLPVFVASDRQNRTLDGILMQRGAFLLPPERVPDTLRLLAIDFFVLSDPRMAYFTGNQLSSVSQNVCYRRLGRGQRCNGFNPTFATYHARVADADLFVANLQNNSGG